MARILEGWGFPVMLMGHLILWVAARTGLGAGTVKVLGVGLVLAAGVLAFNLWLADVRRDALRDAAAHMAEQDRRADADAGAQRRVDDARTSAEFNALERMRPDAPFVPVGPDEQRRFDCIRLQQQARRHGEQSPACD